MTKPTIQQSIASLVEALEEDKEPGSYFYTWQANIAMSFKDEWRRAVETGSDPCDYSSIHDIANKAAQNFLNMLCYTTNYSGTGK